MDKPKAVYAGSFNPFTTGHLDILVKASKLFRVTIAIARNSSESSVGMPLDYLRRFGEAIAELGLSADVDLVDGLIVRYAEKIGAKYLIRGIKDIKDFLYEEELAKYNKMINPEIETVYFRAESNVSSSFVRELKKHGESVNEYVLLKEDEG